MSGCHRRRRPRGRPRGPTAIYGATLARLCGLHNRTVNRWIAAGRLPAVREGARHSKWIVRWRDVVEAFYRTGARGKMGRALLRGLTTPFSKGRDTGWPNGLGLVSWRNRDVPAEWRRG